MLGQIYHSVEWLSLEENLADTDIQIAALSDNRFVEVGVIK